MSSGLFRPLPEARSPRRASCLSGLPLSIAVHVAVVLVLVVIPLLAADVLPLVPATGETWMLATPLPSVPPPQPAAPRRVPALPVSDPSLPPTVTPNGIAPETGIEREVLPPSGGDFGHGVIHGVDESSLPGRVVEELPPPPPPVTPVRLSLLKQPVKLVDVRPEYPEAARQARIDGVVIIEAVIGAAGEVREARVLRSRPFLGEAALAAVRQWRYTPTTLNGVPVPVIITVTVTFSLQ
jgi:protein TonB